MNGNIRRGARHTVAAAAGTYFPGASSVCLCACAGLCCIWVLPPSLCVRWVHGRRVERNFLLPFFPLANGGARASGPEGGRWVGFRRE